MFTSTYFDLITTFQIFSTAEMMGFNLPVYYFLICQYIDTLMRTFRSKICRRLLTYNFFVSYIQTNRYKYLFAWPSKLSLQPKNLKTLASRELFELKVVGISASEKGMRALCFLLTNCFVRSRYKNYLR